MFGGYPKIEDIAWLRGSHSMESQFTQVSLQLNGMAREDFGLRQGRTDGFWISTGKETELM